VRTMDNETIYVIAWGYTRGAIDGLVQAYHIENDALEQLEMLEKYSDTKHFRIEKVFLK